MSPFDQAQHNPEAAGRQTGRCLWLTDMPTFTLDTEIHAPIERCFDLARDDDFHTRSSHVPERAIAGKTTGLLELGDEVTWEARHFCKLLRLTARIVAMEIPSSFAAEMIEGPFASHTHRFTFRKGGDGTTTMHEVFSSNLRLAPSVALWTALYLRGISDASY